MATKKKSGSKKPRKAPRSAAQKAATRKMLAANKARKSGSKRSKSSKRSAPKGLGARVSRLETRVARHDVQIDQLSGVSKFMFEQMARGGLIRTTPQARQLAASTRH